MENAVFEKIVELIKVQPSKVELWFDLFSVVKAELKDDRESGLIFSQKIKRVIGDFIKQGVELSDMRKYQFEILKICSPYSLDDYFMALEFDRPIKEKFYLPRRKVLLPVVRELEKLLITNELDEMFLSMPPRVGKTTLCLFIVSWLLGTNSELANLYASCSGQLCNAFYKGVGELITDAYTYQWAKIFKDTKFDKSSFCNAKETYIDTGRIKRYHSITCRSIDADGLNGACDCNGLLIGDDLCSGIEEALNTSRMIALWSKVNNNLLTRAKMGAKILWVGTRWSKADPIGLRENTLVSESEFKNRKVRIVNMSALDDNENSNFDYLYGVGFDTEYFKQRRKSFEATDDLASWLAQYQGEPIERSGLLFPQDSLKLYNGVLPIGKIPDRVFGAIDIAWGGGDYTSMPIAYQYGNEIYIHDFVFSNKDKFSTRPMVVDMIIKHNIKSLLAEANNGGSEYIEYIENELKSRGYKLNITLKRNNANKEIRIFDHAPEIKTWYFLETSKRSSDYRKAMEQLCSYVIAGKNKHDDCPDSLSMLADSVYKISKPATSYEVFTPPF